MDRQSTESLSSAPERGPIKLPSFSSLFASIQPHAKPEPLPLPSSSRRDWAALTSVAAGEVSQSLPTTSQWLAPDQARQSALSPQPNPIRLPSMQLSPVGGPSPLLPSGLVGGSHPSAGAGAGAGAGALRGNHSPPSHQRKRSNSLSIHPYANAYTTARSLNQDSHADIARRTSLGGIAAPAGPALARQARLSSRSPPAEAMRNGSHLPPPHPSQASPGPPHVVDFGVGPSRARAASVSEENTPITAWSDREGAAAAILSRSPLNFSREPQEGAIERQGGSSDSLRSLVGTSSSGSGSPGIKPPSSTFAGAQYERQIANARLPTPDLAALKLHAAEGWRGNGALPPITAPSFGSAPRPTSVPSGALGGYRPGEVNPHAVPVGAAAPPEVGRYGCPHCPKRFARPSSLRIHIHSHTGEKPFSCEHCHRGFSVQSNLRRHLKIHRTSGLATAEESEGGGSMSDEDGEDEPMTG